MTLGDGQIERYSRQIIVPRMGGRAQERLLAARLVLAGTLETITIPLAYLVGAGVGTIHLAVAGERPDFARLIASMRDLNPDAQVNAFSPSARIESDLLFGIVSGSCAVETLRSLPDRVLCGPSVTVRLDNPARIAILPSPPPCLRCAAQGMLGPTAVPVENPGFFTMAACVEALKLLAGYEPATPAAIIEFDGYASASRPPASSSGVRCTFCGEAK
jgi:hypothetical protein